MFVMLRNQCHQISPFDFFLPFHPADCCCSLSLVFFRNTLPKSPHMFFDAIPSLLPGLRGVETRAGSRACSLLLVLELSRYILLAD